MHCSIVDLFALRDCQSVLIRFIKVVSHTHAHTVIESTPLFWPPPLPPSLSHSFGIPIATFFRVSLSTFWLIHIIYQIDWANDDFLLLSLLCNCCWSCFLFGRFIFVTLRHLKVACEWFLKTALNHDWITTLALSDATQNKQNLLNGIGMEWNQFFVGEAALRTMKLSIEMEIAVKT